MRPCLGVVAVLVVLVDELPVMHESNGIGLPAVHVLLQRAGAAIDLVGQLAQIDLRLGQCRGRRVRTNHLRRQDHDHRRGIDRQQQNRVLPVHGVLDHPHRLPATEQQVRAGLQQVHQRPNGGREFVGRRVVAAHMHGQHITQTIGQRSQRGQDLIGIIRQRIQAGTLHHMHQLFEQDHALVRRLGARVIRGL